MIDSYHFGEFLINGKPYKSNVVLIGSSSKQAHYLENHELRLDDFTEIMNSKPAVIIIGTGAYGVVKPNEELLDFIRKQGIKVIVEPTSDACKEYERLLKEGKKVAAFLHNTC